jgi:hypothetical protein
MDPVPGSFIQKLRNIVNVQVPGIEPTISWLRETIRGTNTRTLASEAIVAYNTTNERQNDRLSKETFVFVTTNEGR